MFSIFKRKILSQEDLDLIENNNKAALKDLEEALRKDKKAVRKSFEIALSGGSFIGDT